MSIASKNVVKFIDNYRQLPRYLRLFIVSITLYLTFTVILGLLLPYIAVKQAPKQLSELLQRPVTLSDVRINPFTLKVDIDQFKIQETNPNLDSPDFIGFEQLTFEFRFWHSIMNTAFSVADLSLYKPTVNVERLNTKAALTFNFSDILDTLAKNSVPEAQAQPDAEPTELPHFKLENVAIVDANLSFIDNITSGQLHYPKVNLKLKSFDSQTTLANATPTAEGKKSNHYNLHFVGNNGGEISTQGLVQLSPMLVVGDLQLTDIQLPQFWSFIDKQFKVNLATGKLSFATAYRLEAMEEHFQIATDAGVFKLDDISLKHNDATVASLGNLTVAGISLDLLNQAIVIETLNSQGLVINTTINQDGSDLQTLFEPINSDTNNTTPAKDANLVADVTTDQHATVTISATKDSTTDSSVDSTDNPPTTPEVPEVAAAAPALSNTNTTETPWTAVLKAIEISNYQLNLNEQVVTDGTLWQISKIQLKTGEINADLSSPIDYEIGLNINDQGSLSVNGSIEPLKQNISSELALSDLGLSQFQQYLSPYINIDLEQGSVSTKGSLVVNNETQQLSYSGAIDIDDLQIKDTVQKKTLLKWKGVNINQLTFDKAANSLAIDHISLTQPYGRIIIAEDKTTNFSELMVNNDIETVETDTKETAVEVKPVTTSTTNTSTETEAIAISINKISINDGSTFFADNSLTPNFAASIEQLNGQVTQLSSSSQQAASVDITGKIDRYAPVTLKGDINPLLEQPFLDLALSFKNVELTSVNPYSGTYAGYYIDKGQLSLDLNYQLENNQLIGDNHLVVDQLKLGKPSDSTLATTLPVTLAIALLQDRHGVIDLGLQVSGDLDEPSFSIGSIVMTAFTNIITKAVTAPFSLLAGLLGGDDDELNKVNFLAGQAALDSKAKETLNKLAKGLQDRPMLMLNVKGAVNVAEDNRALTTAQLHRKLAQLAQMEPEQIPADLTASNYPTSGPLSEALKLLYSTEIGSPAIEVKTAIEADHQGDKALTAAALDTRWHIALYNFSLSGQKISDDALGELAQQRAVAVKAYLAKSNAVAIERVFLLDSRVDLNTAASQVLLTLTAK
ncbi:DUF748 domain-containing protein [Shewanella youngdeokensis]|uniref:DUF748 domain-containing protein n=1 Tax=Shewanella youngdeokensis TaxID=2999068 RepID=A0ABZ0K210_9GAMM|nr:DUF748 domain-containing protein [Shewanella sp. DAU334]